jgi:hypothetical protein
VRPNLSPTLPALAGTHGGASSWGGVTGRCGAVALSPPPTTRHRPRTGLKAHLAALALLLSAVSAPSLTAQIPKSTPTPIIHIDTIADSLKHPPISTRRAFITSLLIPGFAQASLHRPVAAMVFATAEILCIGMARKAAQDLREDRDAIQDSAKTVTIDPITGTRDTVLNNSRFTNARLRARRVHYEDWVAAAIFNHIISSADAYVSANLWDFKANLVPNVSVNPTQKSASIGGTITF